MFSVPTWLKGDTKPSAAAQQINPGFILNHVTLSKTRQKFRRNMLNVLVDFFKHMQFIDSDLPDIIILIGVYWLNLCWTICPPKQHKNLS